MRADQAQVEMLLVVCLALSQEGKGGGGVGVGVWGGGLSKADAVDEEDSGATEEEDIRKDRTKDGEQVGLSHLTTRTSIWRTDRRKGYKSSWTDVENCPDRAAKP